MSLTLAYPEGALELGVVTEASLAAQRDRLHAKTPRELRLAAYRAFLPRAEADGATREDFVRLLRRDPARDLALAVLWELGRALPRPELEALRALAERIEWASLSARLEQLALRRDLDEAPASAEVQLRCAEEGDHGLQRRLVNHTDLDDVLRALAEHGREGAVRARALRRLASRASLPRGGEETAQR